MRIVAARFARARACQIHVDAGNRMTVLRHGVRCAIYTRRSVISRHVTALDSIANQRDICAAYIRSQQYRDWHELADRYDDDGVTGSTLSRSGLQRLLGDIQRGLVDTVVIYKLDRLTRSLAHFMQLVELFDKFGVTFVCVTQPFDTNDTVGRLILNILLTFAQFEREMTADRMRDRFKTLARNGQWPGGRLPLGYDLVGQRLVVNPAEAAIVREVFVRFAVLGCYTSLCRELAAKGYRSKAWLSAEGVRHGGNALRRRTVRNILSNRVYLGELFHQGEVYPGLHRPIVSTEMWEEARSVAARIALQHPPVPNDRNHLSGLLFDGFGRRMGICSPVSGGKVHRYYSSNLGLAKNVSQPRPLRVDARVLEDMVRTSLCLLFRDRFELTGAALRRSRYDADIETLLQRGPVAARLLETLDDSRLRSTYRALVRRIEVTRETVRVILGCDGILAMLAWDGLGQLRRPMAVSGAHDDSHVVEFASATVRVERIFSLPVAARKEAEARKPNARLVALIALAREVQEAIHTQRHLSMREIAAGLGRQQGYIARVLLLNYLAPDIQTAILDGRQPAGLTSKRLLYSRIPMDWAQQRTLLGFPPQAAPIYGPTNHHVRITGTSIGPPS